MIRPAMVADIWALRRRPQRRMFFYTEAMLASSYRPFAVSLRAMLGPVGDDVVTLVLRNGGARGFLQARKRAHAPEIDLSYLAGFAGLRGGMPDGDVWYSLVENLLQRAGQARIERVFAAVGQRFEDMTEVLKQLGFQPYTQQQIWMLPEPTIEAGSAMVALRRQHRRDAWPIHQLYTRTTPRHVLQGEQRQSSSWQLPRPRRRIGWRERGWVLGNDQALDIHVHVLTGPRGHVLRLLYDPAVRHQAAAMVRYSLSQLHEPRTVFAIVRGYQSEIGSGLEELGFKLRGEQTLFVKHLAVADRQPSRVPALLRGEPSLESITTLPRIPNGGG
ncbi:MAG: hypothetical protein M3R24_19335 [Chloroflexota bacterium]|nr:hypothetical protein [Chloroflexota bacterium]